MSKTFRVRHFTENGKKYRYVLFRHYSYNAVALQKEIPESLKNVPSLYGVYKYYDITSVVKRLEEESDQISLKEVRDTVYWKDVCSIMNNNLTIEEERNSKALSLQYTLKNDSNVIIHSGSIDFFGFKKTIFLYNSEDRIKLDLLVLFLSLRKDYIKGIEDIIVHLPDSSDYGETLFVHNTLGFKKVTSYLNSNSGNRVHILKKSLINEKI